MTDRSRILGKVLIIDDELSLVRTISDRLARQGFEVAAALDGGTGLRMAEREEFDAILLDLRMPGMDGMEVLKELQRRMITSEVIVLTAYGSVDSAVDAMKLGAMDYLEKPLPMSELSNKVALAVARRNSKSQGIFRLASEGMAREFALTQKQAEVLEHLLEGKSNGQIAQLMEVTESTIKSHLKKLFFKIGVDSRMELVARALRRVEMDM